MDDTTLAQKRADLADKLQLITELTEEATELQREINDEMERRRDYPGDVVKFPQRPSNGPTDQGSC